MRYVRYLFFCDFVPLLSLSLSLSLIFIVRVNAPPFFFRLLAFYCSLLICCTVTLFVYNINKLFWLFAPSTSPVSKLSLDMIVDVVDRCRLSSKVKLFFFVGSSYVDVGSPDVARDFFRSLVVRAHMWIASCVFDSSARRMSAFTSFHRLLFLPCADCAFLWEGWGGVMS